MNNLVAFLDTCKKLYPIIAAIDAQTGTAYIVGGGVRDLVLNKPVKDFDIEIHGLTRNQLEAILKKFGPLKLVGKKFGVFRLHNFDIDWSLPRRDSLGRKPEVIIDPDMTIEQAAKRRDITMNAMAIDLHALHKNFEVIYQNAEKNMTYDKAGIDIIDPHGGLADIKNKTLHAVDINLFIEDPLRFFRIMQFIGRFEMYPDKALNQLCAMMDLTDPITKKPLARERIFEEIKKLFLKSKKPSLGFRWLLDISRLKEIFPELEALVHIDQRDDYHPEGNVFEHTMQTLDAAARLDLYQGNEKISAENEKFLIMMSMLCHDLGKITTTDQDLSCKGHDKEGEKIAKIFLKRITRDADLVKGVCTLVRYHMQPTVLVKQKATDKAYKRLAKKLAPYVSMKQLALVALADIQGRNPHGNEPLTGFDEIYTTFMKFTENAHILHEPEPPVLQGRDLLDVVKPGKQMGEFLKEAYRIQIEEGIKDKEKLKSRVLPLKDS
ncbi:MAG: HD domain-containing protein [bacterium]